jgi:acyl-CoA thioester hydrolase
MGKAFRMDIALQPGDIDALSHVNNVVYLQWVQDVSAAHWFELSTPEIRDQYAWVVLRHEIDYIKSAKWGDELYAETGVGDTAGFK